MISNYLKSDSFLYRLFDASGDRLAVYNKGREQTSIMEERTHWVNCSLICKTWNDFAKNYHPFSISNRLNLPFARDVLRMQLSVQCKQAIKDNLKEKILSMISSDCLPKIIEGTRLVEIVNYTPYLCALDYGAQEIANIIHEHENGLSEKFVRMKLITLRFELKGPYLIDGQNFYGDGLDHYLHHKYLIPDVAESLRKYFAAHPTIEMEGMVWDADCTQQLLDALTGNAMCTACSPENGLLPKMFIYSDTAQFENRHWISVAYSQAQQTIGIGNCGVGCGISPGAKIYSCQEKIDSLSELHEVVRNISTQPRKLYLPLPEQRNGSCARKSLEAAIKSDAFFILSEKYPEMPVIQLTDLIYNSWLKSDHIACVNEIMDTDTQAQDPKMMSDLFRSFEACHETKCRLADFVRNQYNSHLFKMEELNYTYFDCKTFPSYLLFLKNLKKIEVYANQMKSLPSLESLPFLEHFNASNNVIETFPDISKNQNLRYLDLSNNAISSVFIQNMERLEFVLVTMNQISDFKILGCKKIKMLHLDDNQLEDFSGNTDLETLEILSVRKNPIKTIEIPKNLETFNRD